MSRPSAETLAAAQERVDQAEAREAEAVTRFGDLEARRGAASLSLQAAETAVGKASVAMAQGVGRNPEAAFSEAVRNKAIAQATVEAFATNVIPQAEVEIEAAKAEAAAARKACRLEVARLIALERIVPAAKELADLLGLAAACLERYRAAAGEMIAFDRDLTEGQVTFLRAPYQPLFAVPMVFRTLIKDHAAFYEERDLAADVEIVFGLTPDTGGGQ